MTNMIRKYMKGVVLLGVLLSIGFTSCQVVNKYQSPEIDVTDLYRDMYSADTTTIANIPWREYFTDPILQALIDEGLNNNYDMRMAFTRIKAAEASLGMARAAYFPSVALAGTVQHNRSSADLQGQNKDVLGYHNTQYSLGIAVAWEADLWGKLNRQARASYAQFLNSHAYRNLIQTSLISNIATTYYSILALDEQLRVTRETVGILEESTETMKAMMEAGLMNRAGVKQSEGLLYSTRVTIPALENQVKQLENSLCLLLGRKPQAIVRTTIQDQTVPTELQYGIPAQMLARRPDVMQAELTFRSAFEMTNVAQASFYPSITLNSGSMIGFGAASLSGFFKPENIFASIIGGLTQPIFARKQLTANLKIAKAQQEEALLAFEKAVLNASVEVSSIMYNYESSLRKNEDRAKQVESLEMAVSDTEELLMAGEAYYTEVLTAQQGFLQAQLNQVNDKLEQLQASVDLYRALGGGIE